MKRFSLILILAVSSSIIRAQCVAYAGDDVSIQCSDTAVLTADLYLHKEVSNTNEILTSVHFPTPEVGYVVGFSGTILKTTDGGSTWQTQNFLPSEDWLSVYFTSIDVGYISSGIGKIYKTTDGGNNWTNIYTGQPNKFLTGIKFIDDNHGFIIGAGGTFIKTINGGATWTVKPTGVTNDLQNLDFLNEMTGYIVGEDGTLLKTTDGGDNWIILNSGVTGLDLYDVDFINENIGYIAGDGLYVLKTTDGGLNWEVLMHMTDKGGFVHRAIEFVNEYKGFLGGNWWNIITTDDGGLSWSAINSPESIQPIRDLDCPDNQSFVAVGNGGAIYTFHLPVFYQWEPSTGLNTTGTQTVLASPHETTQYVVSITTSNGCTARDTVIVSLVPPDVPPQLCMATVETSTNFNKLIWEKDALPPADSVFIYKESSVLNDYRKIGALSNDQVSEFVDTLSNASVQSNRYSISTINVCSIESEKSPPHKTMHLSINQGVGTTWNLIWEPYEGFTVNTYNIYRGISRYDFELIASLSGINTQYTDLDAPAGAIFYKVEAVSNYSCNPSKGYNSSFSNVASYFPGNNNVPLICMATVDTVSNYTKLFWNLPNSGEVDSVIIYRENLQNGEYIRIGSCSAKQASEFLDELSSPSLRSESYKLTSIDANNLESNKSLAHRTMHLSVSESTNNSWRLNWNEYEGFTVDNYNIYRGGSIADLQMIAIISGNNSQYTDLLPPSGSVFYQVEATGNNNCNLGTQGISVLSNIARHVPDGISDDENFTQILISPNPVTLNFTLNISKPVSSAHIEIFDALGVKRKEYCCNTLDSYNISDLPVGVYYVKVTMNNRPKHFKIIKQ